MYTGKHARLRPLQPAFIMAGSGEAVAYRELEGRCNRLAHMFRRRGLRRPTRTMLSVSTSVPEEYGTVAWHGQNDFAQKRELHRRSSRGPFLGLDPSEHGLRLVDLQLRHGSRQDPNGLRDILRVGGPALSGASTVTK